MLMRFQSFSQCLITADGLRHTDQGFGAGDGLSHFVQRVDDDVRALLRWWRSVMGLPPARYISIPD
jgi:hypothetical protein